MRKFENLIDLIDNKDYKLFIELYSKNLHIDFKNIFNFLFKQESGQKKIYRLYILAEFIFGELQSQHFGAKKNFIVEKNMKNFQDLLYHFSVFYALDIDYNLWKELSLHLFRILKDLSEIGDFEYRSHPDFKKFEMRKEKILKEIRKDPDMNQKFFEFLNGAY